MIEMRSGKGRRVDDNVENPLIIGLIIGAASGACLMLFILVILGVIEFTP